MVFNGKNFSENTICFLSKKIAREVSVAFNMNEPDGNNIYEVIHIQWKFPSTGAIKLNIAGRCEQS